MRTDGYNKTADAVDQLSTLYTFQGISLQSIFWFVLRTEFLLVVLLMIFQFHLICKESRLCVPRQLSGVTQSTAKWALVRVRFQSALLIWT